PAHRRGRATRTRPRARRDPAMRGTSPALYQRAAAAAKLLGFAAMSWSGLAIGAAALGVAAIVHQWTVFSQTLDEPAHVSAGGARIDAGGFELDPHRRLLATSPHPPLARVLLGLGPYLRGARHERWPNWILAGNAILYGNGDYMATLASARA